MHTAQRGGCGTYEAKLGQSSSLLPPDSPLSSLKLSVDLLSDSSVLINIYEPPSNNIIIMGSVQSNGELHWFSCLESALRSHLIN